jgi:hypothetical protein
MSAIVLTLVAPRKELYRRGGLMSVTSRILVVDMLQSDIPMHLISGIIMLHAEKYVSPSACAATYSHPHFNLQGHSCLS